MAKIYYTVNETISWHEIAYIDEHGEKHNVTLEVGERSIYPKENREHLKRVHEEFKRLHPGAIYEKPDALGARLRRIREEKARIAAWNAGELR